MLKKSISAFALVSSIALFSAAPAQAEDAPIVNIKRLSLEMAQQAAMAAVEACRKEGVQVAATVVDRGGHAQAVLRDVLAMDLTLTISKQKAYTALSFNSATSALVGRFDGSYSVPKLESLTISAGGVPITAGGAIVGGIGVSGAPSGEIDEKCAKAGVEAITADLEMAAF